MKTTVVLLCILLYIPRLSLSFSIVGWSPSSTAGGSSSSQRHVSSPVAEAAVETNTYDATQITVLEGLEPVRKRPGMYIGSTGPDGLHHLVWEVVDNSVDEALAGHATFVSTTLNADGSVTVVDDGRGIPTDVHPTTKVSALETVLTVLHAGGKFNNQNANAGYSVSGGLHGVGISVVNALSSSVQVVVQRQKEHHTMQFERGVAMGPLASQTGRGIEVPAALPAAIAEIEQAIENIGESVDESRSIEALRTKKDKLEQLLVRQQQQVSGTQVTFLPDHMVFKGENGKSDIRFDPNRLMGRMDEIAYLNAGLLLSLTDHRNATSSTGPEVHVFYHAGGLAEYIDFLCATKTPLFAKNPKTKGAKKPKASATTSTNPAEILLTEDGTTIVCSGSHTPSSSAAQQPPIGVSIALRWSSDMYSESILSFCNNIRTKDGGAHVDGLKACLTRTINQVSKRSGKQKEGAPNLPGEFIREGLTAVVSVSVAEPEFEGQTKGRLGNPDVRPAVDAVLAKSLTNLFEWRPDMIELIYSKASQAQAAAAAARAARDMVRRKTLLTSTVLPGKLADCASRDPATSEIFIVEGDSAAGSAKQGRDRHSQAILPLRGKILNIERAATEKIYKNNELQGLISALGLGVKGSDFDFKSLRYHKIIIMTDADVDGSHIRVLLLTFFYRYQRELIENGHVYIAQPPLYKVSVGTGKAKKEAYAFNDDQKDKLLMDFLQVSTVGEAEALGPTKNAIIQRFKGLGEMMPDQLWSTAMDPEQRTLQQVSANDAALADQMLSMLMGDAVGPRKEFISSHAENLQAQDLDL